MRFWREWWQRLRRHNENERGLRDEIAFHLDQETAKNMDRGMTPDAARRAALVRFGGVEPLKEDTRDQFRPVALQDLWRDLRMAARLLRRTPAFSLVALLTLTLAVGANTAIFSVVRGVLLRPLPFADAGRLVRVWTSTKDEARSNHSAADFLDIRERNQSLAVIAGFRGGLFTVSAVAGEPEQLEGQYVTVEFFDVLGTPAALGRTFSVASDRGSAEHLVVLSDKAWQELYAGATTAIGQSLRLNGTPHRIAGVMPPAFAWPEGAKLWVLSPKPVPPSPIENGDVLSSRDVRYFEAVARLKPGVSIDAASADLHRVGALLVSEHPDTFGGHDINLFPLREEIVGDVRPLLLLLQIAVGVVLLVACANVSGLMIARAAGRRRELAVRAALGATRWHLLRQMLAESVILGVVGGASGLLLGGWLLNILVHRLPGGVPRVADIGLDSTVALVMLAAAVVTSLVFGMLPAWQASRANAGPALTAQGERVAAGRTRARSVLIVGEIALTLMLLVAAGLLASSFVRLARVDSGFRPDHVTIAELVVPQARYTTGAKQVELYRRLIDELSRQPGVQAAGMGFPGPLRGTNASGTFFVEGRGGYERADRAFAYVGSVSGGYFQAMGISLLTGRTFTEADDAKTQGAALVNATLAQKYWPGQNAVGKRVTFDDGGKGPWVTIVGVVGDVRHIGLKTAPPGVLYIPYAQFPLPFTNVAVRSTLPAADVAGMMRRRLAAIDPELPFAEIVPLQHSIDETIDQPRFRTMVVGLFAGLALALAVVGVYGLISYSVTQRTREIGIRVALGARSRHVLVPVVTEGARLAVMGIGLGLAASLATTRLLSSFLYGVGATDPLTFALVALVVLTASLLASYVPSRRAAHVDPLIALRRE
jgi:predicted permease